VSEPPPAPAAPTAPEPRTSSWTILRARWGEATGRTLFALVFVWLLGLVPALLVWAWGGPGGLARTPAIAWDYAAAFHAVPLVATGSSLALRVLSPTGSIGLMVFVCPMLGTLAGLALCFHAGRWLAGAVEARVDGRAPLIVLVSAVRIAVVYGLAFLGVSAIAKLSFAVGEGPAVATIHLHPALSHAFVAPFLVALAGALAGAYSVVRRRASGAVRAGGACLTGGAAALSAGIVLGIVGWAVLAVARPDTTAAYARWLAARGPAGAGAVVANQTLALPNHGMLVLAPAMGVCDRGSSDGQRVDLVCLRHYEVPGSKASATQVNVPSVSFSRRPTPSWFLAFLLIPLASCLVGGVAATREFLRDRPAVRAGAAALLGAGAGASFAVLCAVAAMLVAIRADAVFSTRSSSVSVGPNPWLTGLFGLGWGLVFCTVGALAAARTLGRAGRVAGPGPERPDPRRL
jgi:hypothetical protein